MELLLLFGTLIVFSVNGCSTLTKPQQPGKELYQSLPVDERLDFLVFSLGHSYTRNATKLERIATPGFPFPDALGIDDERVKKFQNLEYPANFSSNLYAWIRARYELDETTMRSLILRRSVCLANGNCIDINDIGGLCCPF